MEPHKTHITVDIEPSFDQGPLEYFIRARKFAYQNYAEEIKRISSVRLENVDEHTFFREYLWTVHTTGFSAKAVGKFFDRLAHAYGRYDVLASESFQDACARVRQVCNNPSKIMSVHMTSRLIRDGIAEHGWEGFRAQSLSSPELLKKLPYVGKITCFHLARNIGLLDSVKPDLHLIRMAEHWGFEDCNSMCQSMQQDGMPLGIIDLILWYSASTFGTGSIKKDGQR